MRKKKCRTLSIKMIRPTYSSRMEQIYASIIHVDEKLNGLIALGFS
jgi:hypothetical protein